MPGCLAVVLSTSAVAADAPQKAVPNRQDIAVLAATCVTCHAPQSTPGGIPALSDHTADALLARLSAFKSMGHAASNAHATIMPLLLQGYDDAQIAALATWFARKETSR